MTWQMVDRYGLPSLGQCLVDRLAGIVTRMARTCIDAERSESERARALIDDCASAAVLLHLLGDGWPQAVARGLKRDARRMHDRLADVLAGQVMARTLGIPAPDAWEGESAFGVITQCLHASFTPAVATVAAPAEDLIVARCIDLLDNCTRRASEVGRPGQRGRLRRLVWPMRRLQACIELSGMALSEGSTDGFGDIAALRDTLARLAEIHRIRAGSKTGLPAKTKARLRRVRRRHVRQARAEMAAIEFDVLPAVLESRLVAGLHGLRLCGQAQVGHDQYPARRLGSSSAGSAAKGEGRHVRRNPCP